MWSSSDSERSKPRKVICTGKLTGSSFDGSPKTLAQFPGSVHLKEVRLAGRKPTRTHHLRLSNLRGSRMSSTRLHARKVATASSGGGGLPQRRELERGGGRRDRRGDADGVVHLLLGEPALEHDFFM